MPARSKKQAKLMQAAAHNPKFAKKVGISKKTAEKVLGKNEKKGGKRK